MTRLATAMHEAGHAVISNAISGHGSVNYVTVTGKHEGFTAASTRCPSYIRSADLSDDARAMYVKLAWLDVLDTLAGPIAELRWRRAGHWGTVWSVGLYQQACFDSPEPQEGTDLWQVKTRLRWAFGPDSEAIFKSAWFEACDLVTQHWKAIQEVGRNLHKKGRLEFHEIPVPVSKMA